MISIGCDRTATVLHISWRALDHPRSWFPAVGAVGLLVALLGFGAAIGGLVGLAFAIAQGRPAESDPERPPG